jgi:hypothetical protein
MANAAAFCGSEKYWLSWSDGGWVDGGLELDLKTGLRRLSKHNKAGVEAFLGFFALGFVSDELSKYMPFQALLE